MALAAVGHHKVLGRSQPPGDLMFASERIGTTVGKLRASFRSESNPAGTAVAPNRNLNGLLMSYPSRREQPPGAPRLASFSRARYVGLPLKIGEGPTTALVFRSSWTLTAS